MTLRRVSIVCLVLGGLALVLWVVFFFWQHWLAVHLGILKAGPDPYYNAQSGAVANLALVSLPFLVVGGVLAFIHHHNCDVTGCKKLKSYAVRDTPWKACKDHHPHIDETDPVITPERIATFTDRHPPTGGAS
jgi:hypothetical protein